MNRRQFLKRMGLLAALSMVPLSATNLSLSSWAALSANDDANKPRLIVIFLRGAVDGLNVIVPYGDPSYYQARPTIAIPQPGQGTGAIDLDGRFGLHPALSALTPMWKEGSLAFIPASGSPDASRSHFDAQDYMESGTPGVKVTPDGWMNRLLGTMPGMHSSTQAVSLGEAIPRILSGRQPVANLPQGQAAGRPIALDRADLQHIFGTMYSGHDEMSRTYQEGIKARKELLADLDTEQKMANNGAPLPFGFSVDATHLSQLIKNDPRVELAFLGLGGWDTHVNQGSSEGQLSNHLKPLGDGLATLVSGLGNHYDNTVIVVMSEFGRTVHENGNAGTDHGHGNVMWVMGGPVKGGKIYGAWPGLSPDKLYQQRDLAVTTDFRNVLSPILGQHFGLAAPQVADVFPSFHPTPSANLSHMLRA